MKKLIFIATSLMLAALSSLAQFSPFPDSPSSPLPYSESNSTSFFLASVDPSVYPNQDANFTEVTSVASGDWSDPSIWDCNCVPNSLNSITIAETHAVTAGFNVVVNTLHIRPDASLDITQDSGLMLEVKRDMAVYGSLELSGVELSLNSTTSQQLLGNISPSVMKCNGLNDIVNNGNLFVSEEFWVGACNFYTNDNMFIANTATNSVEIAPIIYGDIIGEMTVSTEITADAAGWISVAVAASDATVQTLDDDFVTLGFIGADYPDNAFTSVAYYVEESDDFTTDYAPVQNVTDPLIPGVGYYLYVWPGDQQLNHTGLINKGDVEIPVDYTDNDTPSQDGLNLSANPYPATINWDSQEGWERENMSKVIYIWDNIAGQFKTYMNGLGINGGSPFIKPMEAVWVVASGDNPSLTVNERAKALYDSETIEPTQHMRITLANASWYDELIITSGENAAEDFDANYDAFKFNGASLAPNITCHSSDDVRLAINDTPLLDEATTVALYIDIKEAGDYTVSFEGVVEYVENQCITVLDLVTNEVYDLRTVTEIDFTSAIVEDTERFVIQVGDPIDAQATAVACTSENTGTILASGAGAGPWDYTWFDADMNQVGQVLAEAGDYEITDLPAGNYTVQIENNDFCPSLMIGAEIVEPEEVLEETNYVNHIGCFQDASGEISLEITGGEQPYFVEWDNGELGANINGLTAGSYAYTITDGAGCIRSSSVEVTEVTDVLATFSVEDQTIVLDENGQAEISFTNMTTGANTYEWSFGEGTQSDLENPSHTYTEPGSFTVSLYATNEDCDDYQQLIITVEQFSSVSEQELGDQVNILLDNNTVRITSNGTLGSDKIEVTVYDLLGKVVSSTTDTFAETNEIRLNLDEANALYVVSVVNSSTGEKFRRKISRF